MCPFLRDTTGRPAVPANKRFMAPADAGGSSAANDGIILWTKPGSSASPRLWRLVVFQALQDIFVGKPRERREAIRWLDSEDFSACCDEAQIAPGKVRKLAETMWAMKQDEQLNCLRQLKQHLEAQAPTIAARSARPTERRTGTRTRDDRPG